MYLNLFIISTEKFNASSESRLSQLETFIRTVLMDIARNSKQMRLGLIKIANKHSSGERVWAEESWVSSISGNSGLARGGDLALSTPAQWTDDVDPGELEQTQSDVFWSVHICKTSELGTAWPRPYHSIEKRNMQIGDAGVEHQPANTPLNITSQK